MAKKMPPLPDGSSQRSAEPSAPSAEIDAPAKGPPAKPAAKLGIDQMVRRQRADARRRAKQLKTAAAVDPRELVANMATAAAEMSAATQQLGSAGRQLEGTMSEIASAARQAASATTQSAASVNQVLNASRATQESIADLLGRMRAMESLVNDTVAAMQQLIAGINIALEVNTASGVNVREVQKQGAEVRSIVRAVTDVADQINLYAFNAALEASRAGKHGAGFSVVADEVRMLAQKATDSAAGIDEVLSSLEAAIEQVGADMDRSVAESQQWADEANNVVGALASCTAAITGICSAGGVVDARARHLTKVMERTASNSAAIATSTAEAERASLESTNVLGEQTNALRGIQEAAQELALKSEEGRETGLEGGLLEEIGTIADELAATIQQASSAAAQIGSSIRQISRAADDLSRLTQENLPAIIQSQDTINDLAERAQEATGAVKSLAELVSSTSSSISSVLRNVSTAAARNEEYAGNIKRLQGEVLRIDEVVDALIAISLMTNLLAVHGRIEGARAGEAGVGLGSVSEDIRQLAEEANNNVVAVRRMIRAMQLTNTAVAVDLEKVGGTLRNEVDKVSRIAGQLARIIEDISILDTSMGAVSVAASQAAAGIPQVRLALESIADAARQTASATLEASGAAAEQAEAMGELASSVDDLALQLTYLRKK